MFSRNAFKAKNVCVNVPGYHVLLSFYSMIQNTVNIFILLILWSQSQYRAEFKELSHALHWKASLISLPTETWNWRMELREKDVLFHPQVKLCKAKAQEMSMNLLDLWLNCLEKPEAYPKQNLMEELPQYSCRIKLFHFFLYQTISKHSGDNSLMI